MILGTKLTLDTAIWKIASHVEYIIRDDAKLTLQRNAKKFNGDLLHILKNR